jgi:uncharacterized membrane protein
MARLEVRVTIDRPVDLVFAVYTQGDTFPWSDMRSARWVRGKPWEPDSRMLIEPNGSHGVTIDQVLTRFDSGKRIDFISHFGGVTLVSQVNFHALSEEQTELHTQLEFVGTFSRIAGFALGPAIEKGARSFYRQLKAECERRPAELSAEQQYGEGRV